VIAVLFYSLHLHIYGQFLFCLLLLSCFLIVYARFNRGEVWYRGVISSVHIDDTYCITYNDGDEEEHVPSEYVRLSRHVKKKPIEVGA
jgi:hypothetical protein